MQTKLRALHNGVAALLCIAGLAFMAWQVIGTDDVAAGRRREVVELRGTSCAMGMATQWGYPWLLRTPADPPLGVHLRDGDLVHFGVEEDDCEAMFVYREDDGPVLNLWLDAPLVRVNGRPNTLFFGKDMAKDISLFADEDLARLEFVIISDLSTNSLAQLRRLATVNPHIGLGFDSGQGAYSNGVAAELGSILASFDPDMFIGAVVHSTEVNAPAGDLLAGWTSLQTLFTSAARPEELEALAGLPALTDLTLIEWDAEQTGPMPEGMENLRSLALFDAKIADLEYLAALSGLEALSVGEDAALTSIAAIARLPMLRRVGLQFCEEDLDLSPLYGLERLEHVSLPVSTTQEQLVDFVDHVPDIRRLDLVTCESITNLAPLAALDRLEALSVHAEADLEALASFDKLQFLLVLMDDEDAPDERARVARLRAALPDCTVVTTVSPCLGSGYLLLLLPAAVLAVVVGRRIRRTRRAGA